MEPEVRFLLFCEQMIVQPQTPPWIYNPYITITPPIFPSSFTFTLALGIDQIVPTRNYQFRLRIKDPDGKQVGVEQPLDLKPGLTAAHDANKFTRPDGTVNAVANIEMKNFPLEKQGFYTAEVLYQNKVIGSAKMYVSSGKKKGSDRA